MTLLKPFAALATVWNRLNDFQQARLKLTSLYIFLVFILLNIFVGSVFFVIQKEERQNKKNIEVQWNKKEVFFSDSNIQVIQIQQYNTTAPQTDEIVELFHNFSGKITEKIFLIEIFLLFLASIASYFLSGRTLKPIEEKNKKQQEFLADVSHELKNPLSALKTSIEISRHQKEWKQGEIEEVFSDLESEISRLIHTTDDLLQLENISSQKQQEKKISSEILSQVIEKFSGEVQKKNITLEKNIVQKKFSLPQKYAEIIFFNLLHNAIKFSPSNSTIHLSVDEKNIFRIKDSGIGIAQKDLPHIFERFYKADQSRTFASENGSGLGLSLVKKICDAQGWKISVESEEGKGSVFMVEF